MNEMKWKCEERSKEKKTRNSIVFLFSHLFDLFKQTTSSLVFSVFTLSLIETLKNSSRTLIDEQKRSTVAMAMRSPFDFDVEMNEQRSVLCVRKNYDEIFEIVMSIPLVFECTDRNETRYGNRYGI